MHLFVGLGNPGSEYELTRHNIGFMLMDALAHSFGTQYKSEHNGLTSKIKSDILIVKPQTYMNLSGECVQPLMSFYKIPPENIVVCHDEVDIPFGRLKLQNDRSPGGHNGIKSIHQKIGSNYKRLRMGVGRPSIPQMQVVDYVLQNFNPKELELMPDVLENSIETLLGLLDVGFDKVQNRIKQIDTENQKQEK